MQIIVEPVDMQTEMQGIVKLVEEPKGVTCDAGAICKVGRTKEEKEITPDDALAAAGLN